MRYKMLSIVVAETQSVEKRIVRNRVPLSRDELTEGNLPLYFKFLLKVQ